MKNILPGISSPLSSTEASASMRSTRVGSIRIVSSMVAHKLLITMKGKTISCGVGCLPRNGKSRVNRQLFFFGPTMEIRTSRLWVSHINWNSLPRLADCSIYLPLSLSLSLGTLFPSLSLFSWNYLLANYRRWLLQRTVQRVRKPSSWGGKPDRCFFIYA